jgi:hypothetical protein
MKLDVKREACCSQDDQMGPLEKSFEMPDESSLGDLLAAVMGSRFLQFSSTHTEMSCRIAGQEVATVFSPYAVPPRAPAFRLPADTSVRSLASNNEVEFVFLKPSTGAAAP